MLDSDFKLVLVSDRHQGVGLGTELLYSLLDISRQEKLSCITAEILPENRTMQHLCRKLGFILENNFNIVKAYFEIK